VKSGGKLLNDEHVTIVKALSRERWMVFPSRSEDTSVSATAGPGEAAG
jgi:hypothetical protein